MKTEISSELKSFWEAHLIAWKETRLSQAAYCQKHELLVHRFGYWKRKLVGAKKPSSKRKGFVRLNPVNRHPASTMPVPSLTVQLPNQLRIKGITFDNLELAKQLAERLQ